MLNQCKLYAKTLSLSAIRDSGNVPPRLVSPRTKVIPALGDWVTNHGSIQHRGTRRGRTHMKNVFEKVRSRLFSTSEERLRNGFS